MVTTSDVVFVDRRERHSVTDCNRLSPCETPGKVASEFGAAVTEAFFTTQLRQPHDAMVYLLDIGPRTGGDHARRVASQESFEWRWQSCRRCVSLARFSGEPFGKGSG